MKQKIVSYRSSASKLADALSQSRQKLKALEILDPTAKEIPVSKYNAPHSLRAIIYGYVVSRQKQKGLKLAEELNKGIFTDYDYFSSLSPRDQRFLGRQNICSL